MKTVLSLLQILTRPPIRTEKRDRKEDEEQRQERRGKREREKREGAV